MPGGAGRCRAVPGGAGRGDSAPCRASARPRVARRSAVPSAPGRPGGPAGPGGGYARRRKVPSVAKARAAACAVTVVACTPSRACPAEGAAPANPAALPRQFILLVPGRGGDGRDHGRSVLVSHRSEPAPRSVAMLVLGLLLAGAGTSRAHPADASAAGPGSAVRRVRPAGGDPGPGRPDRGRTRHVRVYTVAATSPRRTAAIALGGALVTVTAENVPGLGLRRREGRVGPLAGAVPDHLLGVRVRGPAAAGVRQWPAAAGGQPGGGRGTAAYRAGTARRGGAQHERDRRAGGLRRVRHRRPAGRRRARHWVPSRRPAGTPWTRCGGCSACCGRPTPAATGQPPAVSRRSA